MSSKSSNSSPISAMQPSRDFIPETGRGLRHEDSLGNRMLKSIDPDWLLEHKDLLELLTNNPNDPAPLEQVARGTMPMELDADSPVLSAPRRMPLTERSSSQHHLDLPSSSSQPCEPQLPASSSSFHGQSLLQGTRELSPSVETPHRQSRSSSLQIPRAHSRLHTRSERSLHSMGRHSEDRREAGLVPEISLAARAGSLGATSLQTPYRFQGGHKALSESALQTSGEDSDPVKVEQEEEEEQPARKGPGRKKRTTPILVETEDGETKYVTPAEFRKLRRRITNRLSARRMRKKHAEERNVTQTATKSLEDERNYYKESCEQMQEQLEQMQVYCQRLRAENQSWKTHWSRLNSEPQLQLLQTEDQRAKLPPQAFATPMEPLTPAYIRPPMQTLEPVRQRFEAELQPTSLVPHQYQMAPHIPGMPFIPLNPAPDFPEAGSLQATGGLLPSQALSISSIGQPFSSSSGMMDSHSL